MANPLKQFSRVPKIYITLPTNGKFYPDDLMHFSADGQVGIKAMTASDDILMNSPDSLLNGDAIFNLLMSCVVGLKDAHQLLVPDVEAILLAIRYASHGDKIELTSICTNENCRHEQKTELSARSLIDATATLEKADIKSTIEVENEGAKIRINLRPSPYDDRTKSNIMIFNQQRLIQFLRNNRDITSPESHEEISKTYEKIVEFNKIIVFNSIESIDIIENGEDDEIITKVTDKKHIEEFLNDAEKSLIDDIHETMRSLNEDIGIPSEIPVVCEECSQEYTMEVKFDQSNFSESSF